MMLGTIGAVVTLLAFLVFLGIGWWAYSPRFKKQHERDGMIPFLDSEPNDQQDQSRKQP